jgi:V8-like Glu-specific endopeptidase
VLTNFHVVEKLSVGDVACRFDYAKDTSGLREGTPHKVAGAEQGKVAESSYDPDADAAGVGVAKLSFLDYALLRLEAPVEEARPLQVKANAVPADKDRPVLIVQHPNGTPQALAIGKSLGVNENGSRFRYDADTEAGSSGSGVYNQKLELIALHHGGDAASPLRPPSNQGIPIGLIVASVAEKKIAKFWQ